MHYDIIIIGGGAAGLMAAVGAGRAGGKQGTGGKQAGGAENSKERLRILVLEKMPRPGRKIVITGKGRCSGLHSTISPRKPLRISSAAKAWRWTSNVETGRSRTPTSQWMSLIHCTMQPSGAAPRSGPVRKSAR